jgi:hypothetical protein
MIDRQLIPAGAEFCRFQISGHLAPRDEQSSE